MSDEKKSVLELARKRFESAIDSTNELRKVALEDLEFSTGNQWPEEAKKERSQDNRPCLVINRIPQFIRQVTNDQKQNKPAIKVFPVDDKGDIETAKILQGLVRHIEYNSNASIAYNYAFDGAVRKGFGFFRIITDYIDATSFDQEILIKKIQNHFSVVLDPNHIEPDGSDAEWGFIFDDITKEDFLDQYKESELASMDDWQSIGSSKNDWISEDKVRIAEYFYKDYEEKTILQLEDGSIVLEEDFDKSLGIKVLNKRKSLMPKVKWCVINGIEILEEKEFPCEYIPIIPVYGEEVQLEDKRIFEGIVRHAKDSQRMYNYWAPLRLDTLLPTPTGWTTMGDVKVGDTLFDEFGKPCKVLGTSPIYDGRECFKITFDDGSHIIADKEHGWTIEERGKRKAANFEWITKTLTTGDLKPGKHFIYSTKPLELPEQFLEIDPYLLGVWLGDGTAAEPRITAGPSDAGAIRKSLEQSGHKLGDIHLDGTANFTVKGIRKVFSQLQLLGNKHVPEIYLRASASQRLALIQGLMDTDGTISQTGQCSFTNTNPEIRDAFAELLRSMGIKAKYVQREGKLKTFPNGKEYQTATSWQFSFTAPDNLPVFRLSRHLERQMNGKPRHARRTKRYGILSVEQVESTPVKCVAVDTPTHLFLAGTSMIPTHNSSETEAIALAPRAPYLVAEGQIPDNYKEQWANANRRNYPYLTYKPTTINGQAIGAPQRNTFEPAVQAITNARMQAADDMKATTGIYDSALGAQSREVSGVAIRGRQAQSQTSNFHFVDNLHASLRHAGRIVISLIPKIYDRARAARIIGDDDQQEIVFLNQVFQKDGETKFFDLNAGKYDVAVEAGPSFATKRQEALASMIDLTKSYPQVAQVAGDLMVKNMDWPGASEIAERLKKMLPPQLADDKNQKQIPPEAQAQIQQMSQMLDQLTEQLTEKTKMIETKSIEIESKERIEFAKMEVDLQKEAMKVAPQEAYMQLQNQINMIAQRLQLLDFDQPINQNLNHEMQEMSGPQGAAMPADYEQLNQSFTGEPQPSGQPNIQGEMNGQY